MAENKQSAHVKELTKYLAFFNSKKEESFKEIDLDFKDFIYDNLSESIYNKEDVENLIKKWNDQIKKTLSNDLSNMNRMSAIYLQYLFQQTGIEFSLNLNLLEDMQAFNITKAKQIFTICAFLCYQSLNIEIKMIEHMKKVEAGDSSHSLNESSASKNALKNTGAKLPSLFESQKTDQNLLKIDQLEQEIAHLKQENQKLKGDNKQGAMKIDDYSTEGEQELKNELRQLTVRFEQLNTEHKHLQEDSQKKLNESAQFNNLKKMIQQKNEQLKEVKDRQIRLKQNTLYQDIFQNIKNSLSKYEKVD